MNNKLPQAFSTIWLWLDDIVDFEKREHSYQPCNSENYHYLRKTFAEQVALLKKHLTICEDIVNFIKEVIIVNLYLERQKQEKIKGRALRNK
jgi:hypothetical protein